MSLLLSALLVLASIKTEQGRFTVYQDGKKIGTNEFSIIKRPVGYAVDGKSVIGEVNVSSQMELDENLRPTFYAVSSDHGTIRVKVGKPVSEIETVVAGETSSADFRFPEDAVILDNNFFHHYLILLYRVQAGQLTVPVFVPQDMSVGTASVRATGARTYALEVGDVKIEATTDADGRLIKLSVPSAKVVVER